MATFLLTWTRDLSNRHGKQRKTSSFFENGYWRNCVLWVRRCVSLLENTGANTEDIDEMVACIVDMPCDIMSFLERGWNLVGMDSKRQIRPPTILNWTFCLKAAAHINENKLKRPPLFPLKIRFVIFSCYLFVFSAAPINCMSDIVSWQK